MPGCPTSRNKPQNWLLRPRDLHEIKLPDSPDIRQPTTTFTCTTSAYPEDSIAVMHNCLGFTKGLETSSQPLSLLDIKPQTKPQTPGIERGQACPKGVGGPCQHTWSDALPHTHDSKLMRLAIARPFGACPLSEMTTSRNLGPLQSGTHTRTKVAHALMASGVSITHDLFDSPNRSPKDIATPAG